MHSNQQIQQAWVRFNLAMQQTAASFAELASTMKAATEPTSAAMKLFTCKLSKDYTDEERAAFMSGRPVYQRDHRSKNT